MSRTQRLRQAEPPELTAALAKLNSTFTSIAPTSHMFMDAMPQHSSEIRAEPAIGSKLKSTSNLRTAHRDTISDVLARFGDKIPEGQDATELANQLRFAKEDTRGVVTPSTGAPSGSRVGGGFVPFQLGGGTLSKDDLTSTYGTLAAVPVDAEVKRLEEALRHATGAMGAVAHKTLGFTKTRESKGLKDTVGAIITASGAEPILASEYSRSHPFTPEMLAVVKNRDMTHALKNDEERRYAEEKMKFDRMVGVSKPSSKAPTGKAKK